MATFLTRLCRRKTPPGIVLFSTRHPLSTTATFSSKLRSKYSFVPPSSLHPQPPNKNTSFQPEPESQIRKPSKPPYRPPSSLDRSEPPISSDLPFDFRFSYTESNPKVRPIGLREPKYSPFGPERLDRVWTGVCAPAVDPKAGSAGIDGDLEEKRRVMRDRVQGEPLTNAERKALVERCQRHKTKMQINLGAFDFQFLKFLFRCWFFRVFVEMASFLWASLIALFILRFCKSRICDVISSVEQLEFAW